MRWEYKVSNAPTTPRELQHVLDVDGSEEWELVSTTPVASRLLLLFKRPIEYIQPTEELVTEEAPLMQTEEQILEEQVVTEQIEESIND